MDNEMEDEQYGSIPLLGLTEQSTPGLPASPEIELKSLDFDVTSTLRT